MSRKERIRLTGSDYLLILALVLLALAAGTLMGRAQGAMRDEIGAVMRGEIVGAGPQN